MFRRKVLGGLILLAVCAACCSSPSVQAAEVGQPYDWNRFYYYPYVYYPHNFQAPQQYDNMYNLQSWCQIDLERCVGCEVCVHIPGKKSNPYDLKVCPWDAIEMVETEQVAQVVAQIGGPPEYIYDNWDRLVGTAQHLAELKASN